MKSKVAVLAVLAATLALAPMIASAKHRHHHHKPRHPHAMTQPLQRSSSNA
jgi:hypothetical protein